MATAYGAPWTVKESPGKGLGVFATTKLHQGSSLWEEQPLTTTREHSPFDICKIMDNLWRTDRYGYNRFCELSNVPQFPAVVALPQIQPIVGHAEQVPATKLDILARQIALSNLYMDKRGKSQRHFPNLQPYQAAVLVAVFDNNCFEIQLPSDNQETVVAKCVFLIAARLNHSCEPNCHAAWNVNKDKLCIYSLRDIQGGEELYIAYNADQIFFRYREARMRDLKDKYGFTCTCPACNVPLDSTGLNTSNREEIARYMEQIKEKSGACDETSPGIDVTYAKLLDLMEDDGLENWMKAKLHIKLGGLYDTCRAYKEALFHYWNAEKLAIKCFGEDHEETKKVQKLHADARLKA